MGDKHMSTVNKKGFIIILFICLILSTLLIVQILFQKNTIANPGNYDHVLYLGSAGLGTGVFLLDKNTGIVWMYDMDKKKCRGYIGKLNLLGRNFVDPKTNKEYD
jgi:hypothetical protein